MSKKIWKYSFIAYGSLRNASLRISIPEGATVVHVDAQNNNVCIWAIVNPEKPHTQRVFYTAETDQEIAPNHMYIGTVLLDDGNYVVHVFEDTKSEIINDQG